MEGTIFQTISDIMTKWFPIATSIIGTFALIAMATPNKSDDKIVQFLEDIINFLGGNLGKAKNKPEGQ